MVGHDRADGGVATRGSGVPMGHQPSGAMAKLAPANYLPYAILAQ
ncbi:MAG: hypothetical protein M0Z93_10670 [Actinomycetota bacterium]|nr:hypothetical protein [Actinomycetota bacterium]